MTKVPNPLDFTGKTILVTGGGAGIGRACAEAFADHGGQVFIAEIDPERCAGFAAGTAIECDVTKRGDVVRMADRIGSETGGRLDVLVNNVGHYLHAKPFSDLTMDEVEAIIGINLTSLMGVTHAMLPLLRAAAPDSSIVNITSIEAFMGHSKMSAYAASKFAVRGLTQALAIEWARDDVRVNSVAPGAVRTDMTSHLEPGSKGYDRLMERTPLRRFSEPSEIAGAVAFLLGDDSTFVTGTHLSVDGGYTA